MDLLAISNLPWDSYFPPGVGPVLGGEARTHVTAPDEIARWLKPPFAGRMEGEGVGGSPTNAALALAGLGGTVTIVGPVAADGLGARVRAELLRHGVSLVEVDPAPAEQAHSLAFRQPEGERRFLASLPKLSPDAAVPEVAWAGPGWILASAYELWDPAMRRIVLHGFEQARAGGRLLAFDLADPNFARRSREAVDRILELGVAVLQAGDDALAVLLDEDAGHTPPAARLKALARTVLITRGAAGVRVCHEGYEWTFGAENADVQDTTGAGDAFLGAFLLGRAREMELTCAIQLGLAAAAEAVAVLGTRVPAERWLTLMRGWRL